MWGFVINIFFFKNNSSSIVVVTGMSRPQRALPIARTPSVTAEIVHETDAPSAVISITIETQVTFPPPFPSILSRFKKEIWRMPRNS